MTRVARPWVGSRYAANDLPLKILILGDSHHGDVASEDEMVTITTIRDYIVKTNPSYAFFTRISATIANAPYWTVVRDAFYQSVAFFNYVDGVAVKSSRERPSSTQFSSSSEGFQNAIDELDPDVIFCCGADVRRRVASDIGTQEFLTIDEQGIKASYAKSGNRLYFFSQHPSSGYSRHWSSVFQKLAEVEGFSSDLAVLRKAWVR